MKHSNKTRRICAGFLGIYGLAMIYLLFFQRSPSNLDYWLFVQSSCNLYPLRTIREMLAQLDGGGYLTRFAVVNLVGNMVLFVPLGLLPAVWQRQQHFWVYTLTVGGLIVLVELLQLFTTLGSADIDDWLLNLLGAWIGFGIWRTAARFCRHKQGRGN